MIPLSIPDLTEREAENLARCVSENWISSAGPAVAELEQRFAALSRRKTAVAVSSGTTALQLALLAAGVQPGDRVIVPDFTFAATANAVVHVGAIPHFADVSPTDLTLAPEQVECILAATADKPRIRAVLAVDVTGQIANFSALEELCRQHGVALIEDAAGSIGAWQGDRPAGSFGDFATFSLNGNKVVTGGSGGIVVTDDLAAATRIRHLSTQARTGKRYRHDGIGFNFRLSNMNAAVALAQLDRLDVMLAARQNIAARYDAMMARRGDTRLQPMPRRQENRSNGWLYSVLCENESSADHLVTYLLGRNIEARHFWEQLSVQPPYAVYARQANPVAQDISGRVVSLPSSSNLPAVDLDRVCHALLEWQPPVFSGG